MAEDRQTLLTVGAFFLILAVAIVLYAASVISWTLIAPVVLSLFGVWILALAGMRNTNPQKYARGAFSTLSLGLLLISAGGAWYLFSFNWLYSLALILVVLAALAIATALKRK